MLWFRLALLGLGVLLASGCQTNGIDIAAASAPGGGVYARPMKTAGSAFPPLGFNDFCRRYASECDEVAATRTTVAMTPARWQQLAAVNTRINEHIRYVPDTRQFGMKDHWIFATSQGDCEDFALAKKRELVALGWPKHALLIGLGNSRRWGFHAMLVVVTDQGDFALDNNTNAIHAWNDTDMQWTARQSQTHPRNWETII